MRDSGVDGRDAHTQTLPLNGEGIFRLGFRGMEAYSCRIGAHIHARLGRIFILSLGRSFILSLSKDE